MREVGARSDSKAATREQLLHAAREAISEAGWRGARISDVADRAGVAAGSVYTHFASKEELLIEVVRRTAARELAAAEKAAATAGEPEHKVALAAETFCRRALAAPRFARALLFDPVEPAVDAERRAIRRIYRDRFRDILADRPGSGPQTRFEDDLVAAALVGALADALVGPLSSPGDDAHHERAIAALVHFSTAAVRAPIPRDALTLSRSALSR